MKVLVTGVTDGLGHDVVECLRNKGVSVRATGRNEVMGKSLNKMGAGFIPVDLTELISSQAKTVFAGIDTLRYCSNSTLSQGTQQAFDLVNVRVTCRLDEWPVAWEVHNFIHISSPSLYFDYHHHHDIREDFRPHRLTNKFARSKVVGEEVTNLLAQASPHTRFAILRPQSLFGPHNKVFIPRLAQMMQHYNNVPLPQSGSTLVNMTYYENAVRAIWSASQSVCDHLPPVRAQNISNGEPCALRSIAQRLVDGPGIEYRTRSIPHPVLDIITRGMERFGDKIAKEPAFAHYGVSELNLDFAPDIIRAQGELSYQPVMTPDDSIVHTIAWLRDHGELHR